MRVLVETPHGQKVHRLESQHIVLGSKSMSRQIHRVWVAIVLVSLMASGCHPTQPFYFLEDGDLSHYVDSATQIEQPDVEEPRLDEVHTTKAPLTLNQTETQEIWDLTLEEAVNFALANSRVMRDLVFEIELTEPAIR